MLVEQLSEWKEHKMMYTQKKTEASTCHLMIDDDAWYTSVDIKYTIICQQMKTWYPFNNDDSKWSLTIFYEAKIIVVLLLLNEALICSLD